MRQFIRNIIIALICFLVVILLNFALPRFIPGDPVAYLSGFAEEDLTSAQTEHYREALHLNESMTAQFGYYIRSLTDGTLGYSFKKNAVVSELIRERIGATLQISLPAVLLSTVLGLIWGLLAGYRRSSAFDKVSNAVLITLNAVPAFVLALVFIILFCFDHKWFPYTGLSGKGMMPGSEGFLADRIRHLTLPVVTLTLSVLPSRFLLMRNTAAAAMDEKYVLYAKQRGLSPRKIRWGYLLKNIIQPFLTMVGMSVSLCIGGSLVVENIFSAKGMGTLLTDAVYSLDYPLMQGILFVTTGIMVISIILTDLACIIIDPRVRKGESHAQT